MIRFPISAILCLNVSLLPADEVTLANGDRVTGTIVKQDGKNLTIKTELFGAVTMPWSKVKTLYTDKPVHVVLSDGESVRGKIETREDKLEIAGEPARREAAFSEIAALRDASEQRTYERLLEPSWTQLWAGTAALGFAGTSGNAGTRTLSMRTNAARITRAGKTTVQLSAIRSSAMLDEGDELTAQAVRGGWGYSRNVSGRISLNTFNDYEYDRFQNLNLRFVLGAGAGITVWKAERTRLELLSGGAYNRESFSQSEAQDAFVRNSGEAYLGNEFAYKLTAVTAISQNFRFFSNLSDPGGYRFNGDLGANTKLSQWLSWNAAFSNRYLSSPVPGRQKHDFLYTTGIGVTFAR